VPQTKERQQLRQAKRVAEGYYRKLNRQKRVEVLEKLGGKCVECGFSDHRALHVDHVNNDGYEDRKKLKSVYQRYMAVMNDTENKYQLLCANCNFIKKYEVYIEKYGEI